MFVTFEGCEGAGKTTLAAAVHEDLSAPSLLTREPTGSELGGALRNILLNPHAQQLSAETETLLFLADRSHHIQYVIGPALELGMIVLCDRYEDSTIAYQGWGKGGDARHAEQTAALCGACRVRNTPDITFLLDIDPEKGLRRRRAAGGENVFEGLDIAFHRRVREGYLHMAEQDPQRFVILDAARPTSELVRHVVEVIAQRRTGPVTVICPAAQSCKLSPSTDSA